MGLEQSTVPTFAGHQTFHPRFGWIKKGFDAANSNSNVFNEPDAPIQLGVGKNMADAIRFWCVATKVLTRVPNPERPRSSLLVPTNIGQALLGVGGLDPFMEDPSSLWVLHWQSLSWRSTLPIWWATFNEFPALEFTEDELVRYCVDEVATTTWAQPKESSIRKDVDCLLRMYTTRKTRHRQSIDEMLDSPFRELGLVTQAGANDKAYRFVRGRKSGMPAVALTYACLDYMAVSEPDARTASVTRLMSDPGSPGRLLKLTEESLIDALTESARLTEGINLASPAGTVQLVIDADAATSASALLNAHHSARGVPISEDAQIVAGTPARDLVASHHAVLDLTSRPSKLQEGSAR